MAQAQCSVCAPAACCAVAVAWRMVEGGVAGAVFVVACCKWWGHWGNWGWQRQWTRWQPRWVSVGGVLQPAAERHSVCVPTAGTVRHHVTTHIREMRAYSCMRAWKTCAFCVIRPRHHFFFLRAGAVAVAECVSVAESVWLTSLSRHTIPQHTTPPPHHHCPPP